MAETVRQKRITGRVMHEFKHGQLKSGRGGKGGKVKSRRQAIAIALKEAGDSRDESARRNRRNLRRTERKESQGRTAQQAREGKSHLGAAGSGRAPGRWAARMRRSRRARPQGGQCARASRRWSHARRTLCPGAAPRHHRSFEDDEAPAGRRPRPSLIRSMADGLASERPQPESHAAADSTGSATTRRADRHPTAGTGFRADTERALADSGGFTRRDAARATGRRSLKLWAERRASLRDRQGELLHGN